MKFSLVIPVALVAAILAACTPYQEPPPQPPADLARNAGAEKPEDAVTDAPGEGGTDTAASDGTGVGSTSRDDSEPETITERIDDPEPTEPTGRGGVQVARPVPGKPGFVFSPFNNKIIDVKGIPSGTLVQDPTYPASEKKYFRVP